MTLLFLHFSKNNYHRPPLFVPPPTNPNPRGPRRQSLNGRRHPEDAHRPHSLRLRANRSRPRRDRPHKAKRPQEGRRLNSRADRRHHRRQEDLGNHPALPQHPDKLDKGHRRPRRGLELGRGLCDRAVRGQDRGGNGGADRGFRRRPGGVRHVQGGDARHEDRECQAGGENGRERGGLQGGGRC